ERRPRAVASVLRIARLLAAQDAARLQQENRVGRLAMTRVRTRTLYRPVGPAELELIAASGWKAFPPRLPDQPIFYPVLNEQYAAQIAEQWNVPQTGAGYVTEFDVDAEYLSRFEVRQVGGREHVELWVPAEDLATFNEHIVGAIRVVRTFEAEVGVVL